MEAKKNPSKDLSLQRNKFFLIGLAVSITLAITAFEWRTVKVPPVIPDLNPIETGTLLIVPITNIEPPAAPEPIRKMEIKKIVQLNPESIIVTKNTTEKENKEFVIEAQPNSSNVSIAIEPEPADTTFFIVVEKKPEPANGYKSFYQQLSRNLKYPNQAKRMGVEGKVFVEFIVNKNGESTDLKIIKGIGAGCDEEAMRVLALTKWEPGKQRGKPVRVKMVMPISFMLGN